MIKINGNKNIEEYETIKGRITSVHRDMLKVDTEYGELNTKLKAGIYYREIDIEFPAVGDYVMLNYVTNGNSIIVDTLDRTSYFSRMSPDAARGEQVVAANFDYVFILSSLNYDLNLKRLERYLSVSWQSGGIPVVVLTKSDLVDDYDDLLYSVQQTAIGVDVFVISALTGDGMDALNSFIGTDKTVVLLGSSGVGKSSLVNAMMGDEVMKVNHIREDDSRGRHTTTHRQMLVLPNNTRVIDTPGMRELGVWDVSSGLAEAFSDIDELGKMCKFNNCSHNTEPGCAIKAALADGSLSSVRYENYLQLQREARHAKRKADSMRLRQEKQYRMVTSSKKTQKVRTWNEPEY